MHQVANMNAPTKVWANFFNKFQEINQLPTKEWSHRHLLYYIVTRYKQYYNKDYIFAYDKAPTKTPEMKMASLIAATSGSSNPEVWKEYVDWVFDTKIAARKYKIKSLGFFLTAGFGNEFQAYYAQKHALTRSSILPLWLRKEAAEKGVELETYGELAFVAQIVKSQSNPPQPYKDLIQGLIEVDFNLDRLEELK